MTDPTASDQSGTPVSIEVTDGVLRILWQHPETLNSLTDDMLDAAAAAVERVTDDVRCITVSGTGSAFTTGASMSEDFNAERTLRAANRLIRALTRAPAPVIAGVNGVVAGVGVSLALACDLIVARRSAYLLMAFVKVGLMPDGGASELLAASVGRSRALSMAMLGERVTATQAADLGLFHRVVDDEDFDSALADMATTLASGPTRALGAMKTAINVATLPNLDRTLEAELVAQLRLGRTADAQEGPAAFRQKRRAHFLGR